MDTIKVKTLKSLVKFYNDNSMLYKIFIDDIVLLSITFFVAFLLLFLAKRSLVNLSFSGIPDDLMSTAQKEFKQKNKRLTFGRIANLDNPPKKILVSRYFYRYLKALLALTLPVIIIILAIDIFTLTVVLQQQFFINYFIAEGGLYFLIGALVLAYIGSKVIYFFVIRDVLIDWGARINKEILKNRKKIKTSEGELSDVRTLSFKDKINFNPVDYFAQAKEKESVFLGVNEENDPILIPRSTWNKSNIQIMGPPGSGKGVLACTALSQCLTNFNDCVIVFDPKDDEWAPHVLRAHTNDFLLIDLRQDQPAQINIFDNLTAYQLNELLVAGFSLGRRGDSADFYRDNDRQAVRFLSSMFKEGEAVNAQSLLEKSQELPKEVKSSAKGFLILLQELCSLSALQTDKGVDLKKIILNGGCVYVKGSLRDETVIMLQKMLFLRCIQIIEERDRLQKTTHVNIFLDEFRYLLSKSTLEALGTVRDKNCNILLSHQSLGDFGLCGADISEKTASATVIDNTTIKWIYRMKEFKSAEWASKQTGEILVDSERRNVTTSSGNVEMSGISATKYKEKRYLIDVNTIQHLPEGVAALIGLETAKLAYSSIIKVERRPISIVSFKRLKAKVPEQIFHSNIDIEQHYNDNVVDDLPIEPEKEERRHEEERGQWR